MTDTKTKHKTLVTKRLPLGLEDLRKVQVGCCGEPGSQQSPPLPPPPPPFPSRVLYYNTGALYFGNLDVFS